LKQFCNNRSPFDNKVPFQISCMRENNDLLDYAFQQLKQYVPHQHFCITLNKLLHHSDWFHNTVLMELICFEKVNILEEILLMMKKMATVVVCKRFYKDMSKK